MQWPTTVHRGFITTEYRLGFEKIPMSHLMSSAPGAFCRLGRV